MHTEMEPKQLDDPRVSLASERTLLAWVRTALAMMGFGFVVARFGLFLREIAAASQGVHPPTSTGISLWIGIVLVVMGALVTLLAAAQHVRFLDRLERGEPFRPRRWSLSVVFAILLAIIGALLAGYLVMMRR
ncbi:MAG: YidH family protein [Pirellulaceae bacterium]